MDILRNLPFSSPINPLIASVPFADDIEFHLDGYNIKIVFNSESFFDTIIKNCPDIAIPSCDITKYVVIKYDVATSSHENEVYLCVTFDDDRVQVWIKIPYAFVILTDEEKQMLSQQYRTLLDEQRVFVQCVSSIL